MTAPLLLACNSTESTMSDGSSSNRQPLRYIARVSCRACKQEKRSVFTQPLSCSTMSVLAMQLCLHTSHSCQLITRRALTAGTLQRVDAETKANSEGLTCQAGRGMVVTPGSRGHGPKSYLLQKECAESGATNTKHSRVCFKELSKCSRPIKGLTS